jgi:viologen exporter family transport system permease protein
MYAAFARSAFQTQFAYRGQVWAGFFGQLILVFAKVAIWTSVYAGLSVVDGITLADMVTYALIAGTVSAAWPYHDLLNAVGRSIRTGDVAIYLLKPLRYPLYLFATECGNLSFRLITVVVPTVAIVAGIYGMLPPASLFHGVMFAAFWLLSFLLLFLMACAAGLIAFWLMTAFSLDWMLGGILSILSGTFIPLWFFPPTIAAVVSYLPFAFVGYYPTAVYLGKLDIFATLGMFAIGIGWAAVLAGIVALLWARAARRLIVQGG